MGRAQMEMNPMGQGPHGPELKWHYGFYACCVPAQFGNFHDGSPNSLSKARNLQISGKFHMISVQKSTNLQISGKFRMISD